MNYEEEIEKLLGEEAYGKFLDAVESGVVDVQQMTDIAVRLHKNVGGKFKHAKSSQNFHLDRAAARKVLSDWYQLSACDMDEKATQKKFIATLRHRDIKLYPLANEISSTLTQSKAKEMLKFVKEELVNCVNSREVVEIEKLTDEQK